jgi:hypothetical protein
MTGLASTPPLLSLFEAAVMASRRVDTTHLLQLLLAQLCVRRLPAGGDFVEVHTNLLVQLLRQVFTLAILPVQRNNSNNPQR